MRLNLGGECVLVSYWGVYRGNERVIRRRVVREKKMGAFKYMMGGEKLVWVVSQ